jgi:hypothetical protein
MSTPVTATVPHHLGKAEAVRRLKAGIAGTMAHFGGFVSLEQEVWEGDTLRFQLRALGQSAAGRMDVLDDAVRVEITLPWLLAMAANRIVPEISRETTLLLEKK